MHDASPPAGDGVPPEVGPESDGDWERLLANALRNGVPASLPSGGAGIEPPPAGPDGEPGLALVQPWTNDDILPLRRSGWRRWRRH